MRLSNFILTIYLLASLQGIAQTEEHNDITLALQIHNEAREELGLEALIWSEELAMEAEIYAKKLAKTNRFEHCKVTPHGENLYWYSATHVFPFAEASQVWYDEISEYKYRKCCGPKFSKTGHYTQMIWHKTTEVGIGVAVSAKGATYVVARYNPPGNYTGQFPY